MGKWHMMIESVFQSGDIAPDGRLDGWREHLSRALAPMDVVTAGTGDFEAHQRIVSFGEVRVALTRHCPVISRRSPRMIRQSDPGGYHLGLPLAGTKMRVTRPDGQVEYTGDHFVFHDSALEFIAETDHYEGLSVWLPKSLLPFPAAISEKLIRRPIPARQGIGGLVTMTLTRMVEDFDSYQPSDGARLGVVVVDLVAALLGQVLQTGTASEPRQRALTMRIRAFIEQHLADPGLSPSTVAATYHISVSYLHRLFQTEGHTVAAWIRRQRLERARHDLADPSLLATPIHAIGNRWGFPRAADFTRAFRSAYGMPPSDYRSARIANNLSTQC
jgi:AraC-like DNA-binding protein